MKHNLGDDVTTLVINTEEASPSLFFGTTSFSFFTNHTRIVKDLRGFLRVDLINHNYDPATDSARDPTIWFFQDDRANVRCENCYFYLGGGIGIEFEQLGGALLPIYAKSTRKLQHLHALQKINERS
jgi:hypothetical protein